MANKSLPSEDKLDEIRREADYAEQHSRKPVVSLKELRALVECAEALRGLCEIDDGDEFAAWKYEAQFLAGHAALKKLETL